MHFKQQKRIAIIHQAIRDGLYPNNPRLRQIISERMAEYEDNMPGEATINRDIKVLRDDFRAPLEWNKERQGYEYSCPFDLTAKNLGEKDLLFLSLFKNIAENYRGTPFYNDLDGIINFLVSPYRFKDAEILKRIVVAPGPKAIIQQDTWDIIWLALEENHVVEFDYTSVWRGTTVHHQVQPYQIVLSDGMYYLWGFDLLTRYQGVRLFNFPLISNLQELDTTFELPEDYEFIKQTGGGKMGVWYDKNVQDFTIKFNGVSRNYIKNYQWADMQTVEDFPQEDYAVLHFRSSQWRLVQQMILSMGGEAQPLEPAWLVEWWQTEIRKMAVAAGILKADVAQD